MQQGEPGVADAPDDGAEDGGAGLARPVEQECVDDSAHGFEGIAEIQT